MPPLAACGPQPGWQNDLALRIGAPRPDAPTIRAAQSAQVSAPEERLLVEATQALQDLGFTVEESAPTPEQQAAALAPTAAASAVRARESRRFDTADRSLMLQAVVGVLQDLGYTIEESQAQQGVVVASRIAGGRIRAQVALRPAADRGATVVRATFQRVVPRPSAMLAYGETIDDPAVYQGFFETLAQSLFLTAHEI